MRRRTLLLGSAAGVAGLALSAGAHAQGVAADYPLKSVLIIVPFAAGSDTDAFARLVAEQLERRFGQRFVVDDKPGSGGNIGAAEVATAEPDGYTLGMGTVSTHAINPTLYESLPFDAGTDFAPISLIAMLPTVLVVNPSIPARTVPELVDLLKAKPESYTFASSGVGTSTHLAGELLMAATGTRINHVPHKGTGQAILDVVAGHVDLMFDDITTAAPQAKNGKVRALAVTSLERSPLLPDVPTMAGYLPGFEATSWHGIFAPVGTPPTIVDKLSREVQRIMREPDVQERLATMGAQPVGDTPEEFARFIAVERQKWAEVVVASGVTAE